MRLRILPQPENASKLNALALTNSLLSAVGHLLAKKACVGSLQLALEVVERRLVSALQRINASDSPSIFDESLLRWARLEIKSIETKLRLREITSHNKETLSQERL